MKEKTILSFKETLINIKESGLSISAYCEKFDLNRQSIYDKIQEFKRTTDHRNEIFNEIIDLYNSITGSKKYNKVNKTKDIIDENSETKSSYKEPKDTGNSTEISYERDEQDHIIYYNYRIYRKNKAPLVGKLSRDEANIIYRLYSYYGASLTQREVSRYFPDLSLVDFKRVLSAFNIYKASSPFAPHMIEEHSTDELREMQLREKENDFLRKIEEDRIKNNEKLLKKYAVENADLKKQLDNYKNFQFTINDKTPKININKPQIKPINDYINIYLADMHIGACVESGTLYVENIGYGIEEITHRLEHLLQELIKFGTFNQINLCLMGDMMDSCGVTNKTSRLDHSLPENMDGYEQANTYLSIMKWFINSIVDANICNIIKVYSVRCGNHTGVFEYITTKALFAELRNQGIECILFDTFFGSFKAGNDIFIISHGK